MTEQHYTIYIFPEDQDKRLAESREVSGYGMDEVDEFSIRWVYKEASSFLPVDASIGFGHLLCHYQVISGLRFGHFSCLYIGGWTGVRFRDYRVNESKFGVCSVDLGCMWLPFS